MSAWKVSGRGPSPMPVPPWISPAGVAPRLVAWLIDMALMGALGIVPAAIAIATGGVAWNAEAMRQIDGDPFAVPTVPWLVVQTAPLVAAAALWVAMAIVYGAIGWTFLRGLPGQRLRALQVADARTGRNLSIVRATWRAVLVNGIPAAATAVAAVSLAELMSILPANATQNSALLSSGEGGTWATVLSISGLVCLIWPAILLISTASGAGKRGLHDRLSGSMVVGLSRPSAPWSYYYPGSMPGPYGPGGPVVPPGAPTGPEVVPPDVWAGIVQKGAQPTQIDEQATEAVPEPSEGQPSSPHVGQFGSKLPEGLRVASFRRRMAAYGIDSIIILGVYNAVELAIVPPDSSGSLAPERLWMLAGLVGGIAQAVYFVACWSLWRGSIGQKALRLQVGRDATGARLGPADALVRWAVLQGPLALWMATPYVTQLLMLVIVTGWAVFLMVSVRDDADGRGYHDRLAGSMVAEEA